uniref:Uncharacterized protein n=1 Tax=Timema shepardi TaxID=629360 RepID=A0A7R9FZ17_TIMSH|nr:unnamed protein product [Timema shepardi]
MIDFLDSENTGVDFVVDCFVSSRFTTPDGKDVALKWEYNIRASSASQVPGHAVAPRFAQQCWFSFEEDN